MVFSQGDPEGLSLAIPYRRALSDDRGCRTAGGDGRSGGLWN